MKMVDSIAQCHNCGGVLFKIKPSIGCIFYYCVKCNKEVAKISCDKYETVLPTCNECSNDTFKVKITVDEKDSSQDYWEPECTKCKGSPKTIYVDSEGKVINERERQLLIAQEKDGDYIDDLEEEIQDLEEEIEDLKSDINELKSEIKTKDETINRLEEEIRSLSSI